MHVVQETLQCGLISEYCRSITHDGKTFRKANIISSFYLHPKHFLHIGSKKHWRCTDADTCPQITGVLRIVSQNATVHSWRLSVPNTTDENTRDFKCAHK